MKHLFILNPLAAGMKNNVESVTAEINAFFKKHEELEYDIHVTRWARDATGYTRRYVQALGESVRVHSYGGAGLLSEIINGVIDFPDVQIAAYPMGACNDFIRYFRSENTSYFTSIEKQVFSDITPIDIIRCQNYYGISYGMVGFEALIDRVSYEMMGRTGLPTDFCIIWKALECALKNKNHGRNYTVTLDDVPLNGKYNSFLIANSPCYGKDMNPAIEAHPNDGLLDIYIIKAMSRINLLTTIQSYVSGYYWKTPHRFDHYRGKKIVISSDDIMYGSVDGETFLERHVEFEIIPNAISFVCPKGIDINKLPRIYNRPEEGLQGER